MEMKSQTSESSLAVSIESDVSVENDEKETKNEKKWLNSLKKFGDNSSFSAAVYVFKSKSRIKKIFWAGVIISSVVGFSVLTALSIRTLITEPISTSITLSQEKSLEFPAVSVCSLNFLNATKLREASLQFGRGPNFLRNRFFNLFRFGRTVPPMTEQCEIRAAQIQSATNYSGGYYSILSDPNFGRNDPKQLVLQCMFLGQSCIENLTAYLTVSGVCFTFNGPSSEEVRRANGIGARQGLLLQLLNGEQYISLSSNFGYNVIVHNRDEPPRPESEGIVAGLNSALYISMKQVISRDKTILYSGAQCRRGTESFDEAKLAFDGFPTYSPSLCLNECFAKFVADRCGCVERGFYTPTKSPYIEMPTCNLTNLCCETIAFDDLTSDSCDCPPKCETVDRTLAISSATHAINGRVGIHVYYETLQLETRETTDSYTPWSLISDIGGNTGLFLGFTLLTIVEVMMLAVELLIDCCLSLCKQRMKDVLHMKQTVHESDV